MSIEGISIWFLNQTPPRGRSLRISPWAFLIRPTSPLQELQIGLPWAVTDRTPSCGPARISREKPSRSNRRTRNQVRQIAPAARKKENRKASCAQRSPALLEVSTPTISSVSTTFMPVDIASRYHYSRPHTGSIPRTRTTNATSPWRMNKPAISNRLASTSTNS